MIKYSIDLDFDVLPLHAFRIKYLQKEISSEADILCKGYKPITVHSVKYQTSLRPQTEDLFNILQTGLLEAYVLLKTLLNTSKTGKTKVKESKN